MGTISAKFSTPPSGKTMDRSQKSFLDIKWWHGSPLSPCKIWWKSRDARWHERTRCDVFHFLPAGSAAGRAIFKNVLGAFYREWYVVVHLCSNFSVRRKMAPVQSIKFKTANFPIFCTCITVIFWATCIGRQDFFCCINGQCVHILPVLHCLKRGIAFVSSFFFCL